MRLCCFALWLIALFAGAALAQPMLSPRLNTPERWTSVAHTGGVPEGFQLSPVASEPAGAPGGGCALRAEVRAAALDKPGPTGYVELRWTAAEGEPCLDLTTAKALRFSYRIEPTGPAALGAPFLRFAEDWGKFFVGVGARSPFLADGQWHSAGLRYSR